MNTSTPLLRTVLPSLIPLLVFVAADSLFGERVGLIVGVVTGVIDFVIAFVRDKKPDFFILADTVFLVAAGVLSLSLENELFFRLKPAAIELLMGIVLGLLLVLPPRYLKGYMERQLRGMSFSEETLAPMRKSLAVMLAVLAVHIALTIYAALHLSTAAWGFISGVLLYILFALMILAEFAAVRVRNRKSMKAEAMRMAAAPYMAARMGGQPPAADSPDGASGQQDGRDLIGVDYYGAPVQAPEGGQVSSAPPTPSPAASCSADASCPDSPPTAQPEAAGGAATPLPQTGSSRPAAASGSAFAGLSRRSDTNDTDEPPALSKPAPAAAAGTAREEMLPLVDEAGRVRGTAPRSLCHNGPGMLHPVVRLEIFDDKGGMYLQKRAKTKSIAPGLWDSAVGGHVRSGEALDAALARELNEELGVALVVLDSAGVKPSPLLRFKWETAVESELVFVYATSYKGPFSPDPREIEEGRFWSRKEINAAIGTGVLSQGFEYEYKLLAKMRADEMRKKK